MLIAYAVENFFKAAIVCTRSMEFNAEFQSKTKFRKILKSHDLVRLAQVAGFRFDLDQEDLLRRLTRRIGRIKALPKVLVNRG